MTFAANQTTAVNAAVASFDASSTDPKAAIITAIVRSATGGQTIVLTFYNGPTAPKNAFGSLLTIPTIATNLATRSFYDFVVAASAPYISTTPVRYVRLTIIRRLPPDFLVNQHCL